MFYDWIKASQDYSFDLRKVGNILLRRVDAESNEVLSESAPPFHAEGSYCTTFKINVCGRRLTVDGNSSRINRLDNVFGIERLDDNMKVINAVLADWDLPPLTKCTKVEHLQNGGSLTDGAVFHRLDLTDNFSVGKGMNELSYAAYLVSAFVTPLVICIRTETPLFGLLKVVRKQVVWCIQETIIRPLN